ncbi:MAG: hypothetical protein GVY11_00860 [Gammaproteobacteria bacterium]|jgi:plasmid maintenance system antidote protein VapI|nr:hypothetical protein [Gammaproteobacteria bacterium]
MSGDQDQRGFAIAMALRLSRLFSTSAELWLNAQRAVDLWDASQLLENEVSHIRPLVAA